MYSLKLALYRGNVLEDLRGEREGGGEARSLVVRGEEVGGDAENLCFSEVQNNGEVAGRGKRISIRHHCLDSWSILN